MDNDRELLELAAKAAGYEPVRMEDGFLLLRGIQEPWNPLADDGDALRLAVKLNLMVIPRHSITSDEPKAVAAARYSADLDLSETYYEADPFAATRRAIVRAAAECASAIRSAGSGDGREG